MRLKGVGEVASPASLPCGVVILDAPTFKGGNETQLTYSLKWAAWEWLYSVAQCRCIGMEVKLEGPGGRIVDLAGVGPGNTIYVVEVKSSRSDFARDNHTLRDLAAVKEQGKSLARRVLLNQQILTQAQEREKSARERHPSDTLTLYSAYQRALADGERLQREETAYRNRLTAYSIKFHDPGFLASADYHYVMAPHGVALRREMPPHWGLLDETPEVIVAASLKEIRKNTGIISNVLRAIARSNGASMMRARGVRFTEDGAIFPER